MKYVGSDIQNTGFMHGSGEVKGCNQCGCTCTARLDGLNHVMIQHNERNLVKNLPVPFRRHFKISPAWQLISASLQASLHLPYTALGTYHTMKLRYGEDNPDEVRSLQCIYLGIQISTHSMFLLIFDSIHLRMYN